MVLPRHAVMTARPIDAVRPEPMTPWRPLARSAGFESCANPPKRCRYTPSADLCFGSHRAVVAAVRSRICELHHILDLATLRRERHHGNKRGAARFGLDPQLAAELFQARAHAADADAEPLRLAAGRGVSNAFAIVADAQKHAPGPLPEDEAHARCHGVSLHVRQRLLHDPQERPLEVEWEIVDRAGDPHSRCEPGPPAEAVDELSERCTEPFALEIGRMEQVGEDPKLPQALIQGCLDL